jgi:hypothetical protein
VGRQSSKRSSKSGIKALQDLGSANPVRTLSEHRDAACPMMRDEIAFMAAQNAIVPTALACR